ncbi:MAG TPA: L-aspartate oxidase [Gammaproteobacteria bacterium]|jgi:L-aspartate oxidase|nr:MAG: L-aspartate oxidase [Gammaproteobacteria bacterium TMED134]RZO71284.1 MAG: L-aspartate oxidase [OM182 bacterium]HAL42877.1 L-aspartate oxidase [Gammaproteobacteria bacterium]|tara:strand:+ start:30087 stop:31700 length:1614 start_codon:yes stop_codon:yes gene_type:complete
MSQRFTTDVLVIGGGAAGLSTALTLAQHARVTVLCKGDITTGSSHWAQGGVAAVTDPEDSFDAHVRDTLDAGAGLCDKHVVEATIKSAPKIVEQLTTWGLEFDQEDNGLHLTREGGHSHRRVIHVADATGKAITQTLTEQVLDHGNIELFNDRVAIDLINLSTLGRHPSRCAGAYVLNRTSGRVEVFQAKFVVLATGGASKVYLYTSNPDGSTGDGIAMAWRAGCRVANMEFNQFHPTCLYHPHAGSFLISEAVRGEGGVLRLPNGQTFMKHFDERRELAPRDVVARAIDHEMKRLGADCVYLDISHRPAEFIHHHFPNIALKCSEFGIDITREAIPVVPAAHYTCGGVVVDEHGRTDLANLYAVGEVSCTGLHGANRLASNSLLECLVFGQRAADKIIGQLERPFSTPYIPRWDESKVTDSDESIIIAHNWEELRRFMWDYVGIVRSDKRLMRAHRRIELLKQEIHDYYTTYRVTDDLIELRNLLHVADLIVRSALKRKESRGLNFNLDYPQHSDVAVDTILFPGSLEQLDTVRLS